MGDSASIEYVVMKKHPVHALGFAIRDALVASLDMGSPVFLATAEGYMEVNGEMVIDIIEGTGFTNPPRLTG